MDTYSHVLPGLDELAAGTVARLILGTEGPAAGTSPGPAPHRAGCVCVGRIVTRWP